MAMPPFLKNAKIGIGKCRERGASNSVRRFLCATLLPRNLLSISLIYERLNSPCLDADGGAITPNFTSAGCSRS